jgi:hypothetical protein
MSPPSQFYSYALNVHEQDFSFVKECKKILMPLKDKLIPGTLSILVRYGNINFLANEQRRIWSGMIVTIVTQSVSSGQSEPGMSGMPGMPWHPHILKDQLTLSQPGGQTRLYRPYYY